MPNPSSAHGFDPRFHATGENYRASNTGWGIDIRPLPAHGSSFGRDDKYSPKNVSSTLSSYTAGLKTLIQQYWPSWHKRTSRSRPLSPKPSLTTATPSSSTLVFVLLCTLWYSTSALSSNTGKAILTQFRYPITLTFIQFGFVGFYCLLSMSPMIRFTKLRMPTKPIIQSTLPMGMFQVVGHMFSSIAISRIPVSTVHTIKALSPLFTVAAYALLFGVSYSTKTYISLLPLTIGVMLACSFDMSASNAIGLLCAFGSALVFVSSNIFFKKIMPSSTGGLSHASSHKLDKLNLLLYSSGMAFILMIPLWMYYDLPMFIAAANNPGHITHPKDGHQTPHSVAYYFFMNGTVNFAQNIIAFVILSSTSPVTYSIASLIKRVAVICIAIVWFSQTVHPIQAFGIGMTFTGLYMYNNAKADVEQGEKKMRRVEAARDLVLPTTKSDSQLMAGSDYLPAFTAAETTGTGLASSSLYGRPRSGSSATSHTFHHPHATSPHHPYPHPVNNPSITTISPAFHAKLEPIKDARISSPIDSYPSPPPSIDSPPSETIPLDDEFRLSENPHRQLYPPAIVVTA
ncbi:putative transporter C83.11 [Hypsizygus marmoreus]|uniref:Transporter C83.11 n=1 Tax=Hypsizygus marmoreus TaxID=39966 RepID=A0A369JZ27_HYPMA|nr:putative transporter C83.11 [Hypsizygus marmoreus]